VSLVETQEKKRLNSSSVEDKFELLVLVEAEVAAAGVLLDADEEERETVDSREETWAAVRTKREKKRKMGMERRREKSMSTLRLEVVVLRQLARMEEEKSDEEAQTQPHRFLLGFNTSLCRTGREGGERASGSSSRPTLSP
jgi:hypothetical protein